MQQIYTLSPNTVTGSNFFIPANAPYFLDGLTVSIVATATTTDTAIPLGISTNLVLGVDYFPGLLFNQATAEQEAPVYGAIVMADPGIRGNITVKYTPLTGGYSISGSQVTALYNDNTLDPLSARWEDVVAGLPDYPSTDVAYDQVNQVGITAVVSAIAALTGTVNAASAKPSIFDFTKHIGDVTGNPHGVTALYMGIGNVPNWSTAVAADIITGTNANMFVTPSAIANSVNTVVPLATGLSYGKAALNLGHNAGDSVDGYNALTASGLVYMLSTGSLVTFSNLQNNQRQAIQVTPFPIKYPLMYNSVECFNFDDLVKQVQIVTFISPLTYNPVTGTIWFPHNVTTPIITLSYPSNLTTNSSVDMPL